MLRINRLFLVSVLIFAGITLFGCSQDDPPSSLTDPVTPRDKISCAQIQNLDSSRNGNIITVEFDTPCDAWSSVSWGYAPDALDNFVIGSLDTSHSLSFTVDGNEGCVYWVARAADPGANPPDVDTSAVQTETKEIVISNVSRSLDPLACTMTVTWTTNVKSSSVLDWGNTCGSLTNTDTGAGNTTSHSVTVDISGVRANSRIYSVPSSETDCDSEEGACAFIFKSYCIQQF